MHLLRFDEARIICRAPARFLRLLLACALLALLGACSSWKLAYNNSPTLTYWWLDRYVDFEDAQSVEVRAALASLQQWHRQVELPRLADLLVHAQRQAMQDVTPQQLCTLYADVRQRLDALARQAEPAYVPLAMGLKPRQLDNIAARFEKTNAEWRKEWLETSPEEQLDKRLERARQRAEDFYGDLDASQIDSLREALGRSDFDAQRNFRERLRRQQDLLQVLRAASGGNAARPEDRHQATLALRGYLERSTRSPDPAYRNWAERVVTETCQLVANLHNSATTAQRKKAIQKMHIHERSLRELSSNA